MIKAYQQHTVTGNIPTILPAKVLKTGLENGVNVVEYKE